MQSRKLSEYLQFARLQKKFKQMNKSIFILLLFLVCFSCKRDRQTAQEEEKRPFIEPSNTILGAESEMSILSIDLVNQLRENGCTCGTENMPPVSPVLWNDFLALAAQRHAEDMAANEHFSHTGTDQSTMDLRITESGYTWWTVGENIASGYPSIPEVIKGWELSEGHCRNIMNPEFTEMGLAEVNGYWVQTFGKPRNEGDIQ